MRLHLYFVLTFLSVFLGMILLSGSVSYFTIKQIAINQHKTELKQNISLIKIELENLVNLDDFVIKVKSAINNRITLINNEGVVLAESDFDVTKMENHRDRKEIIMARNEGEGYSIRHSNTLNKNLLYYASKFKLYDKPIFIRLAAPIKSIMKDLLGLWLKITIISSIFMLIGTYMAYRFSKRIENEIKKVTNALDEISNKNYKTYVGASFSKEFFDIEHHIGILANKLERRSKQKRKYTAKIKLISKQRSDIISAISHEFKNPIASVIGYAQTLLDDPKANENIRIRFLEKITKNSQKISFMIDRLALAIKFENGDFTPKLCKFDLYDLTHEIVNGFKDKNNERNFTLNGSSHMIKADKTMIEMVIINLIDNAIKYSENDIEIEINEDTLHVKDNGIGIRKDEIEKVTHKFYRSNTKSWDNSIGLGLALVKYILNLHNTTLEIKSEIGKGSDFYFKIV